MTDDRDDTRAGLAVFAWFGGLVILYAVIGWIVL